MATGSVSNSTPGSTTAGSQKLSDMSMMTVGSFPLLAVRSGNSPREGAGETGANASIRSLGSAGSRSGGGAFIGRLTARSTPPYNPASRPRRSSRSAWFSVLGPV